MVYISLAVIRQTDLKLVIACTSVSHIILVIVGLFSGKATGVEAARLVNE